MQSCGLRARAFSGGKAPFPGVFDPSARSLSTRTPVSIEFSAVQRQQVTVSSSLFETLLSAMMSLEPEARFLCNNRGVLSYLKLSNAGETLSVSQLDFAKVKYRCISGLTSFRGNIVVLASNINLGAGGYEGGRENNGNMIYKNGSTNEASSYSPSPISRISYPLSVVGILLGCALAFSLVVFSKGNPSAIVAAFSKSGFTAAFTLIFVSEIGDKTFFIAALLAMQYEKALVLLGSMGALALMTILSVVIGRIFQSVPSQLQTTLPIGEYAAVALLMYFGFKSIKSAWELPSAEKKKSKDGPELGEFIEAEELVKEKVVKRLTSPLEIISKSFSLVFFAEWGDRSMLATVALGTAQSPWGVAAGAIAGHLVATSFAVLGGAYLANYISEKLVGYLGGVLFLIFALATLLGVF